MNNLTKLIIGELKRLVKYKILPVSLATTTLWIVLFLFISPEEARKIGPIVIFVDVAAMSVTWRFHHLEKQDGTIRTMMVMPVSIKQILTAKTIGSVVLAIESAVVLLLPCFLFMGLRLTMLRFCCLLQYQVQPMQQSALFFH